MKSTLLFRTILHVRATVCTCLLILSSVASIGNLFAADRPNILWLVSEDNSFEWIHAYGNEQALTPNIDQLAARGLLFDHAYSNGPVCAVARSTLLRGIYATTAGTQNMRSRHVVPDRYHTYPEFLRKAGYYCTNNPKTDYNARGDDKRFWDECSKTAHYKDRPDGSPFFAVFNMTDTHESSLFDDKPMRPERLDPKTLVLPPYLPDLPEIRLDYARYADRITEMDAKVGQYLDELEKAGLADDTIVIYMGDNGGVVPRGKRYLYDTGVRIPLIISIPAKFQNLSPSPAGSHVSECVAFVDFLPTFLSLLGIDIPDYLQGRAFLGKSRVAPKDDAHVFLFADRFDEFYGMRRALTDGRWKYIRRFRPDLPAAPYSAYQYGQPGWRAWRDAWLEGKLSGRFKEIWEAPQVTEELYDISSDPWEIHNLAASTDHAEKLAQMRQRLKDTMRSTRDTGIIPEPLYPELAHGSSIADYAQSQKFDVTGTLDLAFAASDASPENAEKLRAGLHATDPAQRYWGLIGLAILGEKGASAVTEVRDLLADPYSTIRSTAAYTLWKLGEKEEATKSILAEIKRTEITSLSLFWALNIIHDLKLASQLPAGWEQNMGVDEDTSSKKDTASSYVKRIQDILQKEKHR